MRRNVFLGAIAVSALIVAAFAADSTTGKGTHIQYPKVKTVDQVDDYNGVKVKDPYRWLEDANSPETKEWVQEENKLTFGYLEQIPVRSAIKKRLTELWNFEHYGPSFRYGAPWKQGGRYFFTKNNGLQNQSVLYTMKSLTDEPKVLLDPNPLAADGTVAIDDVEITDDGKLMAYGSAAAGSDWQTWRVRDIESGKDLPDVVDYVKFSRASWTHDGSGFFYSRYDKPDANTRLQNANYYHKMYFHKIGTSQDVDVKVFDTPDHKDWNINGTVTDDGHYLIINLSQGTDVRNRVYYKDLTNPNAQVVKLLDTADASYNFVDNNGPVFWFVTDLDAPRSKLIAIDTQHPGKSSWKTIIPEAKDNLNNVQTVNNQFIAEYLQDAHSSIRIFDLGGKQVREVQLPGIGSVSGFTGKRGDTETFYSFNSYTTPTTFYHLDLKTGKSDVFRKPGVKFDPSEFETKEVFYKSKDGTRIPMFISYKKGIKLDGQNPTFLYGYGGFNLNTTPSFNVRNLDWMEMGGIYAAAVLRGGGEYGKEWHEAGMKQHKQNVFDDFIAAAEYLIAQKYTSTPKLAIGGASNGGLLVGAALTQRPDLFGAALPQVGVMDMLRFNKFTIGWAWTSDYGDPDKASDFAYIYKYSPLHNIKPGTKYPPTFATTADHDDRVVPAHTFKFIATMQADQAGDAPILVRIETRAGHGGGKPTSKQIEEAADQWTFLAHVLGMEQSVEKTMAAK